MFCNLNSAFVRSHQIQLQREHRQQFSEIHTWPKKFHNALHRDYEYNIIAYMSELVVMVMMIRFEGTQPFHCCGLFIFLHGIWRKIPWHMYTDFGGDKIPTVSMTSSTCNKINNENSVMLLVVTMLMTMLNTEKKWLNMLRKIRVTWISNISRYLALFMYSRKIKTEESANKFQFSK